MDISGNNDEKANIRAPSHLPVFTNKPRLYQQTLSATSPPPPSPPLRSAPEPGSYGTPRAAPEPAPYDPYIPSGSSSTNPTGAGGGASGGQKNTTAQLQAQIDDTTRVMRENITKVSERGERLDALQDKTDNLAVSAQGFRRGANRVRKQMWWKDMRMRLLIIAGVIVLIIIIVVPIVKAVKK